MKLYTKNLLLNCKTTGKNIIFATNSYKEKGYKKEDYIKINDLLENKIDIQPRAFKMAKEQKKRTKKRAEVFTPTWICKNMNDLIDKEFKEDWKAYIGLKILEVTCGEAPYLVSRYDTTTGEKIAIKDRVGILDRKLKLINKNAKTEKEWFEYAIRAYKSTYGYEFQGDNLLIARVNLIETFIEYAEEKWNKKPSPEQIKEIAYIVSWNIWQMDGLTDCIPFTNIPCKIMDWGKKKIVLFKDLKEKEKENAKYKKVDLQFLID